MIQSLQLNSNVNQNYFISSRILFIYQIQIITQIMRKLQIDIAQIEREHTHPSQREQQYDEDEQQQDYEQDESAQQQQYSENMEQTSKVKQNELESVQTFGNHNNIGSTHDELIDQIIKKSNGYQTYRHEDITVHQLSQTPIDLQRTPYSQSNKRQNIEQSSLDEQIARIISKVNNKSKKTNGEQNINQLGQIQKIKKIDRINKQLLKQNTELINQINILQKKLSDLNGKIKIKKHKGSSKANDDTSLIKTIKHYKQKLHKAMQLNSKLSVRLTTERSRANGISNTFRSMVKQQGSSSDMIISSLRSNVLKSEASRQKSKSKKSYIMAHKGKHYCDKCGQQQLYRRQSGSKDHSSKQLIFSPVLQVKHYEISQKNKGTNEFELGNRRVMIRDNECQVNIDNILYERQLQQMMIEQQNLQKLIEDNNNRISKYEQKLYQLIELT